MFAPLLFLYVAFFERQRSIREMFRPARTAGRAARDMAVVSDRFRDRRRRPAHGDDVHAGRDIAASLSAHSAVRHRALRAEPVLPGAPERRYGVAADLATRSTIVLLVGVAFVAAALSMAWITSRRRETRPIAYGILWFFIALLPTSSVIPLAEPMNDHRISLRRPDPRGGLERRALEREAGGQAPRCRVARLDPTAACRRRPWRCCSPWPTAPGSATSSGALRNRCGWTRRRRARTTAAA